MKIGSIVEHKADRSYVGKVTWIGENSYAPICQVKWHNLEKEQAVLVADLIEVSETQSEGKEFHSKPKPHINSLFQAISDLQIAQVKASNVLLMQEAFETFRRKLDTLGVADSFDWEA